MTATKKPGRPPRSKKASLARLELRLTEQEQTRWQRAAERKGLSLSGFVRMCVETTIVS